MSYQDIRNQIYENTQEAVAAGLIYLSAGNISARVDESTVAITPGGIRYTDLRPEHIAIVDLNGEPVDAPQRPSSETPMHTHLYRAFPEVGAVYHTHSPFAITFAMLGQAVPPTNLELFTVGAPVPVAPWACPGTEAPGEEAARLLRAQPGLKAVLLRNHGLLAIGKNLSDAFAMAFDAEQGMRYHHQAMQVGTPHELNADQIEEIKAAYA
jgi:ribulose-5-phosphate 4-epimerase/fuculose-1-phosphate aldolase